MTKFFTLFTLIFQLSLFAESVYDIRGASPLLDANMTRFLDKWRTDTITPVKNGLYKNVIVNGDPSRKNIALTFDDAPDENNTIKLLDILKSHHVRGAFFMIGATMRDTNATVVKRTSDEGHLVLNHSFNHPRLSDLNESAIVYQLDHAAVRIENITGKYPLVMRPPYGSVNRLVIDTINAQGVTPVLWSLDSLDWTLKDPNGVILNIVSHIRNGDIILMHRNPTTVGALPRVIDHLKSMGYTFVRLDELLGIKAYR